MAASQRPKSASTNKQGGGRAIATAVKRCLRDLERVPLADRTKDAYGQHVAAYGAWLAGRGDGAKALADPKARDYAARDFKRRLKVEAGSPRRSAWRSPRWITSTASSASGQRTSSASRSPQAEPKALEVAQERELLRAAEASKARDRAIVTLLLYTAIRQHELVALDVDDVSLSARKGHLVIKSGKGDLDPRPSIGRSSDRGGGQRARAARLPPGRASRLQARGARLLAGASASSCSGL